MNTLDNQDHRTAISLAAAESRANLCPLCSTLNHLLSRECFNCGWHGAFPGGDANIRPAELRVHSATHLLSLWWQHLKRGNRRPAARNNAESEKELTKGCNEYSKEK